MGSHGDPAAASCGELLSELYLLLDSECGPGQEAQLRKHLAECPPCFERYGIDKQLKELLGRKCGGDHAPEELKTRLRASIRQTAKEHRDGAHSQFEWVHVTLGDERDSRFRAPWV